MTYLPAFDAPLDGNLNCEMRTAFDEAGVLILRNFTSVAKCEALKKRAAELVRAFNPLAVRHVFSTKQHNQLGDQYFEESGDRIRFFLEHDAFDEQGVLRQAKEHSLNKIGHALHDLDPVFDAFSRTAKLGALVASLEFKNPAIVQSMYIFKPPRIGGEVVCHQDSTYLYTEPHSCLGFWFALEDATLANGCMQFIAGAHKLGLKQRQFRGDDGNLTYETFDTTPWPQGKETAAEAKAGTLVIFDGKAPHLSGPNLSARSRHAYTFHVIDQQCLYPSDNWLQRGANLPLRGFDN